MVPDHASFFLATLWILENHFWKHCPISIAILHAIVLVAAPLLFGGFGVQVLISFNTFFQVLRDTKEERLHHRNAVVTAVVDTGLRIL